MNKRLIRLREAFAAVVTKQRAILDGIAEGGGMTADQNTAFMALDAQRAQLQTDIGHEQAVLDAEREVARGAAPVPTADNPAKGGWESLGHFLQAVAQVARGGSAPDSRLVAAGSGMSEGSGADGGFAVHQDFLPEIVGSMFKSGEVLKRVRQIPIGPNKNGVRYNVIDETSRAKGSRWGNLQVFPASEAQTVTAKGVKLRRVSLDLKKYMGLGYATDELLEDAPALEKLMFDGFGEEMQFQLEDDVFRGEGDGRLIGFLKGPATVKQGIEGGQTIANTNTFLAINVAKMLSRVPASLWGDTVWFYNPELLPTLITSILGVGGAALPVMMPPGGLSASPYGTILGHPAIPVEYAEAVGTPGDLCAAAMSQYVVAQKGGLRADTSVHVRFNYDEMTFRFIYRIDGQPEPVSAVTPYKGALSRSPFLLLDTRV